MNAADLIGNVIFSAIGVAAFVYGKKQGSFRPMLIGGALVLYPYAVPNTMYLYIVGATLVAALFIFR